jgi:hypothetical protein
MSLPFLTIEVEAYVGEKDNMEWVPSLFARNDLLSTRDDLVAIRIDVDRSHPWYSSNGMTFLVSRTTLYERPEI